MSQATEAARPTVIPAIGPIRRRSQSRDRILRAARQLFVEKGYHATRPQDIARLAGIGHGTFYLHFSDKRECFLAFVEEAREDLTAFVANRAAEAQGLEATIEAVLNAIYDYAEQHPGVLATATADDRVIGTDAQGQTLGKPLLARWGEQWSQIILHLTESSGGLPPGLEPQIIGQAIVGAIHQASAFAHFQGSSRESVVKALTMFIARAVKR